MEGDGDARVPGGLGKLGELGDGEVAFLEPELGAVDRAAGRWGEIRAAADPPHRIAGR